LLSVLATSVAKSQSIFEECGTQNFDNINFSGTYSVETTPINKSTLVPLVLNVFYWQVKAPDGSYGGLTFNEEKLLENIAYLNIVFNEFNIFFKYQGYSSFDSPTNLPLVQYEPHPVTGAYRCVQYPGQFDPNGYGNIGRCSDITSFWGYAENNNHKMANAMNIYVPYGSEFGGAAKSVGSDMLILKVNKLNEFTSIHEMGHALGLYHTRSTHNGVSNKEHTTRVATPGPCHPNNEYNAPCADDNVVDTAANTQFSHGGTYPWISESNGIWTYTGSETDEINIEYEIDHLDIINVMSDAYIAWKNQLTPGQGHRMRRTIISDIDLTNSLNIDGIAALFEPYAGIYNDNPAVDVPIPLFQPGFDYIFRPCCCDYPLPSDFDDVTFSYNGSNGVATIISKHETDYSSITHPNRNGLEIAQLSAYMNNPVRKCWNRKGFALGGNLTRFNDGVFNWNVTITPKDSTGINNPTLVQDLPTGLYAIDKDYPDGSTSQTLILKENN